MIRKLLREYLNEIDWTDKFKDVSKTCYVRVPKVINNLIRRLNFFLNHPEEYMQTAINEIQEKLNELDLDSNDDMETKLMLRWNDAGDFSLMHIIKWQKI